MSSNLDIFLAQRKPFFETSVLWGGGTLPLRECHYFSQELPPLEYITSVRSIVFKEESVLVLGNRDGRHIVPGGRCEANETLEETLHREVREETGWAISVVGLLGFVHFHHLNPKPSGYVHPHPDFIQVVYVSEAQDFNPEHRLVGDYETEAGFHPLEEVRKLDISIYGRGYLEAAFEARRRGQ